MTVTVLVCEDAGGASALAPVARALLERGDEVRCVLGPVAHGVFEREGLVTANTITARPDRLLPHGVFEGSPTTLTASSRWGLRLDACAVIDARAAGCTTLTLIDFWWAYAARLSYPGDADFLAMPDVLLAIDTRMAADLIAVGVPRARIEVTGSPAFDGLLSTKLPSPPASRDVLFLSQPLSTLPHYNIGYTERTVLSALAPIVSDLRATLRVRPHPREDAADFALFVAKLPCRAEMACEPSLRSALEFARVAIGINTMALAEAAMLGRPAVSVMLGETALDPLPPSLAGLVVQVKSPETLRREIATALDNKNEFAPRLDSNLIAHGLSTPRVLGVLDAQRRQTDRALM